MTTFLLVIDLFSSLGAFIFAIHTVTPMHKGVGFFAAILYGSLFLFFLSLLFLKHI